MKLERYLIYVFYIYIPNISTGTLYSVEYFALNVLRALRYCKFPFLYNNTNVIEFYFVPSF